MGRRPRLLIPLIALSVVVLSALGSLIGLYTDLLWFRSVGFSDVFTTVLQTKVLMFVLFGVVMAVAVGVNIVVAHRVRPTFRPMSPEQQNLDRYRMALEPRLVPALLGVTGLIGLFAGLSAVARWQTWLLWRNGTSFGAVDAQFGRDVSYFAFTYPFQRFVVGFLFAVVVLSILTAALTHYVFGAIRLQTPGDKLSPAAKAHLSVLVGLFVLLKAVAYFLDRYGLVFSPRGVVTGASYTDVNAVLPAKSILAVVALICALLFFANAFLRGFSLPLLGLGLLVLSAIAIGGIYPAAIQQFRVRPNEIAREATYIQRNIDATRTAYGLNDAKAADAPAGGAPNGPVITEAYNATTNPTKFGKALAGERDVALRTRLLDPNVLSPTFRQLQQIRAYYGFADQLDIDRYDFGNGPTEVVVGVRELNLNGVPAASRNWINDHLIYTHGNGFVAAPASAVTADGAPQFAVGGLPVSAPPSFNLKQPRIYFGEQSPEYSIVNTTQPEIDGPGNKDSEQATFTYDGKGGVQLSNFFTKSLFAIKYGEKNILLNSDLTSNSRILFVRNPRERVAKVAPFLKLDGNPYPAVVDGRIQWIVDAYTTSSGYPYSQRKALGDLTTDALTGTSSRAAQPQEEVNYIRNSVKATVDAYDGSVKLYQFDETDPVLKTWMKAFPGVVSPKSEISKDLQAHLRYPEDLFKVQRDLLASYHVTDPQGFYSQEDFWTVPTDPTASGGGDQPPYYLYLQVPGAPNPSLQLTTVFNARSRPNLSAFMSVSSDPGDYGTIRVLRLPRDTTVPGPGQASAAFESTPAVSTTLSLLRQGGSNVQLGNLLTLPVGGGLLYVEPVYVRASGGESFPLLRKVLVGFGDAVAFEDTLPKALNVLFGQATATPGPTPGQPTPAPGATPTPSATPAPVNQTLAQALADINSAFTDQQAALGRGDFSAAGAAQDRLKAAIARAVAAEAGPSPSPSAAPAPSASAAPSP